MGNNVGNGIKMVSIHVADNAVMTGDERVTIGNDELIAFEAALFAKSPDPINCVDRDPVKGEIGEVGILTGIGLFAQIARTGMGGGISNSFAKKCQPRAVCLDRARLLVLRLRKWGGRKQQ